MTRREAERLLGLSRDADFFGSDQVQWVERLSLERENLEEAVRWFAEQGEAEAAAELASDVWRLWFVSGDVAGGRRLLAAALDAGEGRPSRARALALYADGLLAFRAGAQADSQERNEAALEAARAVNDREAESLALVGLSRVAFREGDYERVRLLAAEARELTRDLDASAGVMPLHMLAAGTRLTGDHDGAVELYSESVELNRSLGDSVMVALEFHNIGHVELHRGNVDAAEGCFAECAKVRSADNPYDAAMTHLNHAALAYARGDRESTAELLGRTQSTLADADIVLDPDDDFDVKWLRDKISS
jgi:tetratricopeptide (TPR) repeat protein